MSNRIHLTTSACALALVTAQSATAQTASSETVIVTATRTPEPLGEVPASVSVVTADQIADTPAQGLDDILRNIPGMTLNNIGPDVGHPTAYNESMRGLPTTETRMLVMVDGVPINDPFFGYIQWNRVPLDDIDHVEVVRGGGSPLWGNTAMGGVVNVITKTPQTDQLTASAAGGSYGGYNTSLNGTYIASDWLKIGLNAGFTGTDGYQTTPASWTTFGTLNRRSPVYTPTSNSAKNIGLRADFSPAQDISGFLNVNYSENEQTLSTPIGLDHQEIWTYAGGLTKAFDSDTSLSATFFHDDNNFVTNNPHLLTFTTEYNSNVHTTTATDNGASLVLTHQMAGWLRALNFGADFHQIAGHDLASYYAPTGALAAAQRTFLAWVHTSIAVIAFGFLVDRFDLFLALSVSSGLNDHITVNRTGFGRLAGLVLIVAEVVMVVLATIRFIKTAKEIDEEKLVPGTGSRLDIALTGLLTALGIALFYYLSNTVTARA